MSKAPPHVARARRLVRDAVKSGRLVRPGNCELCGAPDVKCADGRTSIQGHHHDYSKPLDVEWICVSCHRAETPVSTLSGTDVKTSKLTPEAVQHIRSSTEPRWVLAEKYGVHLRTIARARSGEHWRRVK